MLAALLSRFRSHPFPEPSEELRMEAFQGVEVSFSQGLRLLGHLFDICKEP